MKRVHGFSLCQVCGFHQDFGINRDKCLAIHTSGSKHQQLSKSVWHMWPKTLAQEIHCLQMCIQVKSSLPPCWGHEKSRSCKTMVLSVLLVKHCPDHFALILWHNCNFRSFEKHSICFGRWPNVCTPVMPLHLWIQQWIFRCKKPIHQQWQTVGHTKYHSSCLPGYHLCYRKTQRTRWSSKHTYTKVV